MCDCLWLGLLEENCSGEILALNYVPGACFECTLLLEHNCYLLLEALCFHNMLHEHICLRILLQIVHAPGATGLGSICSWSIMLHAPGALCFHNMLHEHIGPRILLQIVPPPGAAGLGSICSWSIIYCQNLIEARKMVKSKYI